jgi:hypothetical protein
MGRVIVDRHAELAEWTELLAKVAKREVLICGYVNNHYALCRRRHKAYNAAFRIMPSSIVPPPFFPHHSSLPPCAAA